MHYLFTGTIRRMVILAVVLSLLPSLGMLLYSGGHRYREAYDDVIGRGLRVVENVAERQHLIAENTFTILSALLKVGALQDFSPESSTRLFHSIVSEYPLLSNLFIMSSGGAVISSAVPVPDGMSLTSTTLHSRVLRAKGPTLVTVAASPFTGFPVMQFALPLTNRQGSIFGYLCAELRLNFLDRILVGQTLPYGGTIYMLSGAGQLMLSSAPSPPSRVGRPVGGALWKALENAVPVSGHFTYTDENGAEALAIYRRSTLDGSYAPYLFTVMTVSAAAAYEAPEGTLRRDMLLLAAGALVSLLAGLALGMYGFARPVRVLLEVAARLGKGDRRARVPADAGLRGEFAALGEEFNAMAGALEERGRALERDREAAARSSRAKSEFLANMSHEIRTPMNAILGMAHLVGKTPLSEAQQPQVNKIRDAAESLLTLLNTILDYSKLEAGKMRIESIPFHMGRLLNTVRGGGMGAAREHGSRLVTNIAADAPAVMLGDPARLARALGILLEETIRHAEGAAVAISVDAGEPVENGAAVRFSYAVQGPVLSADNLHHITGALAGQGTQGGRLDNAELSLALAGGIMRMLGGDVAVALTPNGFKVTAFAALGIPETVGEDGSLRFDGERVLLVSTKSGEQPVDMVRRSFGELLARYNLRAEECDGVELAALLLREADANGVPFSMVIADMPPSVEEAGGYIERLKHGIALSRPPLLVLSASPGIKRLPAQLADSGVDAFLPRPVNESLLVDMLSGLIREHAGHEDDLNGVCPTDQRVDGLRVLLVEDNAVNAEIAGEILQTSGALVTLATDGLKAVAALGENPSGFDVVLMDLEMPGMNGKEATRALREERGFRPWRLPIIAMTAHNSPEEVSACLEAGMNDHSLKPIAVAQLFETLRRWLPVREDDREAARRIMRKVRHILMRSHSRDPELRGLLADLDPLLGEGRTRLLKDMLDRQETPLVYAMLDDFINDPGKGEE